MLSLNQRFKRPAPRVASRAQPSQPRTPEWTPANVRHSQYGTYPIWIRWDKPGVSQPAIGQCTLIIKPCVRLRGKPTLKTWPGGVITLSLENCGGVGIDISVSITHHGSSWSTGWEFELDTGDGPFKFKETFEPNAMGFRHLGGSSGGRGPSYFGYGG